MAGQHYYIVKREQVEISTHAKTNATGAYIMNRVFNFMHCFRFGIKAIFFHTANGCSLILNGPKRGRGAAAALLQMLQRVEPKMQKIQLHNSEGCFLTGKINVGLKIGPFFEWK